MSFCFAYCNNFAFISLRVNMLVHFSAELIFFGNLKHQKGCSLTQFLLQCTNLAEYVFSCEVVINICKKIVVKSLKMMKAMKEIYELFYKNCLKCN